MIEIESIRLVSLGLSILFFIIGFFKPVFMPLSYLTCFFLKLPNYYPVLVEYRYEAIIAVVGTIRTLVGKGVFSRLKMQYNKYFLIFLFTVLISFLFAWDKKYSWEFTLYPFVGNILIYVMVLCSIKNIKDLKLFIWLLLISYTFMAWEPLYNFMTGTVWIEEYGAIVRAEVGLLEGHRGLANNMNQFIPIVFYLIYTVKNKVIQLFSGIPLIVFVSVLILGKARIGVIGFIFFVLLLIFYSKQRIKYGLIGGSVLICLMLLSVGFSSTASRINTNEISNSMFGLLHGIEMVRKGNLFGVGPGCYTLARGFYFSHTMGAHNLYGEIIGDLGIPGTIASFYFFRSIFINIRNSVKNIKPEMENSIFMLNLLMGIQISLMVRLFIGLATHSMYIFYWYLVAALSIVIYDLTINKNNNIYTINKISIKTN